MNKFIKLTDESGNEVHINPVFIESMSYQSDGTWVRTMSGRVRIVKETPDEIIKLIKKSDNYTIY